MHATPLPDSAATEEHGRAYAATLPAGGSVLALEGPLGAGKTTWVRGLARGLGVTQEIRSPSYTYRFDYPLPDGRTLVHADLYRMPEEGVDLTGFGLDELLEDPSVILVIEWAERLTFALPPATRRLAFSVCDDGTRALTLTL